MKYHIFTDLMPRKRGALMKWPKEGAISPLWLLLIIPVIAAAGVSIWLLTPYSATEQALAALNSDGAVSVDTSRWIVLTPEEEKTQTGFILYPGGRVDEKAYAVLARSIAEAGYKTVIVPMPFDLAVLNPSAARGIIQAFPDISQWYIGGHSLGGAMAARFAYLNTESISGLVLLASYPARNNDLSGVAIPVLSISASLDGVVDRDNLENSRNLLPQDTVWFEIEGGNHAQFGHYGEQRGDLEARVSREEQIEQTTKAILSFFKKGEYH